MMVTATLRKRGNSYTVTIPHEEVERQDMHEGDLVGIEIRKLEVRPQMSPDVRAAFDHVVKEYAEGIAYLADR